MGTRSARRQFRDQCVIYYDHEARRWIAHSLDTDQIGDGDSVLDALVDLMRGVKAILDLAAEDPTVQVKSPAPTEIRRMAETALPLPAEVYEIACKQVHGDWPAQLTVQVDTSAQQHHRRLKSDLAFT